MELVKLQHPDRYNKRFPFECLELCQHLGFNLGNVFKYVYRCQDKNKFSEDLDKAIHYLSFFENLSLTDRIYQVRTLDKHNPAIDKLLSALQKTDMYSKDAQQLYIMADLIRIANMYNKPNVDINAINTKLCQIKENILRLKSTDYENRTIC